MKSFRVCLSSRILVLVLVLVLALSSPSRGSPLASEEQPPTECPVGCPRIFDPVCATDGAGGFQFFHNECLMRADGCRRSIDWRLAPMSRCLAEDLLRIRGATQGRAECLRACPFIYLPVCATDGRLSQVFANDCLLAMERCLTDGKWRATRDSDCGL